MQKDLWLSRQISRRAVLGALGSLGLLSVGGLAGCATAPHTSAPPADSPGLGFLAEKNDKLFGVAVQSWQIDDPDFARTLKNEARLIVPETELKWDIAHPSPATFDFAGYRRLADFAAGNGMDMRGHTMLWHHANPAWLDSSLMSCGATGAEKILRTHIEALVAETADSIRNWDVVNEALDPHSPRPDGLRETVWLKALGPDYIPLAFHIANDADSGLTLTYNEFGLEYDDGYARAKRRALLHLLIKCHKDRVPIHAIGLQSHLQCHRPLGGYDFVNFLKMIRKFGLNIYVTELDVDTSSLTGSMSERTMIAQQYVRTYLEMIEQTGDLDTLLTWGLTDRYSWLREYSHTISGALPLDAKLNRGPLWDTLRMAWVEI